MKRLSQIVREQMERRKTALVESAAARDYDIKKIAGHVAHHLHTAYEDHFPGDSEQKHHLDIVKHYQKVLHHYSHANNAGADGKYSKESTHLAHVEHHFNEIDRIHKEHGIPRP